MNHNYTQDAQGQLTGDGTNTYSYDLGGNRSAFTYVPNPDAVHYTNEILSDGTWDSLPHGLHAPAAGCTHTTDTSRRNTGISTPGPRLASFWRCRPGGRGSIAWRQISPLRPGVIRCSLLWSCRLPLLIRTSGSVSICRVGPRSKDRAQMLTTSRFLEISRRLLSFVRLHGGVSYTSQR